MVWPGLDDGAVALDERLHDELGRRLGVGDGDGGRAVVGQLDGGQARPRAPPPRPRRGRAGSAPRGCRREEQRVGLLARPGVGSAPRPSVGRDADEHPAAGGHAVEALVDAGHQRVLEHELRRLGVVRGARAPSPSRPLTNTKSKVTTALGAISSPSPSSMSARRWSRSTSNGSSNSRVGFSPGSPVTSTASSGVSLVSRWAPRRRRPRRATATAERGRAGGGAWGAPEGSADGQGGEAPTDEDLGAGEVGDGGEQADAGRRRVRRGARRSRSTRRRGCGRPRPGRPR